MLATMTNSLKTVYQPPNNYIWNRSVSHHTNTDIILETANGAPSHAFAINDISENFSVECWTLPKNIYTHFLQPNVIAPSLATTRWCIGGEEREEI